MNEILRVNGLTRDFGRGHGIFDVSFGIKKGETLGFLGPNGAGKSTTIRHLMGFSVPDSGEATILGMNCNSQYDAIKKHIGYLPGEVAIPEGLSGWEFIKMMQGLKKIYNEERLNYLLNLFDCNPDGQIKKMSIGEKRKLAVVVAFMSDPDILILDEPTSGLDPIMQETFVNFIKEEKKKGKTILLSSHIFSEVEAVCDRICIIKDGCLVATVNAEDVKKSQRKTFDIKLGNTKDFKNIINESLEIVEKDEKSNQLSIIMEDKDDDMILPILRKYKITSFIQRNITLESYFMNFYRTESKYGGISWKKL